MALPGSERSASHRRTTMTVMSDDYIAQREAELAQRRRSSIEAARRKGGVAGAALAGAMIAVSEIVDGERKDDAPIVVEANSDPDDIDRDGIRIDLGGVVVESILGDTPVASDDANHDG